MKKNTPGLPKTYSLAEQLGIPLYAAVGLLEMMWHHAGRFTPRGDIGSLPDIAIAKALSWPEKKAGLLIKTLLDTRWLDLSSEAYRFYLHDWPEHCEYDVFRKVTTSGGFLPEYGTVKPRGKSSDSPGSFRESSGKICVSREAMASSLSSGGGAGGTMEWDSLAVALSSRHPKRGGRTAVEHAVVAIATGRPDEPELAVLIDQRHQGWCAHWHNAGTETKFLPKLENWLRDGTWRDEPESGTPSTAVPIWEAPSLD